MAEQRVKSARIVIWVEPKDKERFLRAAQSEYEPDISAWARKMMLKRADEVLGKVAKKSKPNA